jgi:hypothetical protein
VFSEIRDGETVYVVTAGRIGRFVVFAEELTLP